MSTQGADTQIVWRGVSWDMTTGRRARRCRACNRRIPAGEACYKPTFTGRHAKEHQRLCVPCSADKG